MSGIIGVADFEYAVVMRSGLCSEMQHSRVLRRLERVSGCSAIARVSIDELEWSLSLELECDLILLLLAQTFVHVQTISQAKGL